MIFFSMLSIISLYHFKAVVDLGWPPLNDSAGSYKPKSDCAL